MSKKRNISFYYYKINFSYEDKPVTLNLSKLLEDLYNEYNSNDQREVIEYNGEKAKLSFISLPGNNDDLYQMTFERLRDYNFPVKSKLKGDSSYLSLSNEEFLGEEVTVLYDKDLSIMMIQNNRNSLSFKSIELFLNSIIQNNGVDGILTLNLMIENNPVARAKRLVGAREVLYKGNIQVAQATGKIVSDLFDSIKGEVDKNDADLLNVELKITAKNKVSSGKPYLPDTITNEIISYTGDGGVTKLSVKGSDANGDIDEINLIEAKITDKFIFEFTHDDRYLNKTMVFNKMREVYTKRFK